MHVLWAQVVQTLCSPKSDMGISFGVHVEGTGEGCAVSDVVTRDLLFVIGETVWLCWWRCQRWDGLSGRPPVRAFLQAFLCGERQTFHGCRINPMSAWFGASMHKWMDGVYRWIV